MRIKLWNSETAIDRQYTYVRWSGRPNSKNTVVARTRRNASDNENSNYYQTCKKHNNIVIICDFNLLQYNVIVGRGRDQKTNFKNTKDRAVSEEPFGRSESVALSLVE